MHTSKIQPLESLDGARFDTPAILKKLAESSRLLAELKGVAATIPNQGILINTLGLQEAKDSSEIENIVTTHDELFKDDLLPESVDGSAAKEVLRYRQALRVGFAQVCESDLLTSNHILLIQAELERNNAGYRKLPGTSLKNSQGDVVYEPPQDPEEIIQLMNQLERFINDSDLYQVDPLIKMALIHHQFESIHPFYDGNGRTGRIINVLYLVKERLLNIPVLYLSNTIVRNKDKHKFYSQDLINNLFAHPYTKIEFVMRDLKISRLTATKYLDKLAEDGFLEKRKIGRINYYINIALNQILLS